uniref:Uncharacterized protein n=1 Tax=Chenopodium quinoa TaxID=63459 RepID=A0A803LJT6_CHEQI
MGAPKQKWIAEEEAALKARDKWRNIYVTLSGLGSREKARLALKRNPQIPKLDDKPSVVNHVRSDEDAVEDELVGTLSETVQVADSKKTYTSEVGEVPAKVERGRGRCSKVKGVPEKVERRSGEVQRGRGSPAKVERSRGRCSEVGGGVARSRESGEGGAKSGEVQRGRGSPAKVEQSRGRCSEVEGVRRRWSEVGDRRRRLDNLILEAITTLQGPKGSDRNVIAMYIEVKHRYRISETSPSSKTRKDLWDGKHKDHAKPESKELKIFTTSEVVAELGKMKSLSPHEAAAAAAEAEVAILEAEKVTREAEAAEAKAKVAKVFAEAAIKGLKCQNLRTW